MSQERERRIGLLIGSEWDWPSAFMDFVNEKGEGITAELVKISSTPVNDVPPYTLIIDRISHVIPYYRAYLKYATLYETHVVNDPDTWSSDNKFFGIALANKLGLAIPRTVILPNKDVAREVTPSSFRNLSYPMDWQGIIDYVGVPAIFKDIRSGGRRLVYRVNSVDELIQQYDESGTRTMLLQELIDSDDHIHGFVVGQEAVMLLRYSLADGRYLPDIVENESQLGRPIVKATLRLAQTYGYDINMVEFIIKDDKLYVINSTNPAPVMDRELMTPEQFDWCVQQIARLAIERVKQPPSTNLHSQ